MKLKIVSTLSIEFDKTNKNYEINELSNLLETYFLPKDYGTSIESYIIGITCVSHGFDAFFTARKPKYTTDRIESHWGLSAHIYKSFEFTIKLDYDFFRYSDKEGGLSYLAKEIMKTVQSLKYPKKITDFNRKQFEMDLEYFFKEKGLL